MITRGLTLPKKILSTLNLPQIIDITDQLPKHKTKRWGKRDFDRWEQIVIHHANSDAPIENQTNYHINHHGWPGIAYLFTIYQGVIYQTNDLASLTTHAKGVNEISIGICVIGKLQLRPLTTFERNAIYGLIMMLKDINPSLVVKGHNEASWEAIGHKTECPCTDMDIIRKDVATLELKLAITDTPNDKLSKATVVRARTEDLYKIASDPKNQYNAEGLRKMNAIYDIMVTEGLIKVAKS